VVVNAPLDFTLKHLDPKHAYLSSRGFTPETIEHFGLGYCNKGMMAERTAIPLHDAAGKLIGYAGRLVDDAKVSDENPKYRFPGTRERDGIAYEFHKSEFLYNGHGIDKPVPDLIVVEGFASVWWLWQHGYPNVVALMGNSISVKQAELLRDLLGCDGRLWILSDGDNAGEHCAKALFLNLAPHHFVRWLRLDDGQPTDLSSEELDALLPPQTA
jgi:DNA primase